MVSGSADPGRGAADDGAGHGAARLRKKLLPAAAAVVVAVAGASAALFWHGRGAPAGVAKEPSSGTAPAGDGSASGAADRPAAARNPLRAGKNVAFYAPAEPAASRQAAIWAADRPKDAELMRKLAAVPYAIRLNRPEARPEVENAIRKAEQAGAVPVFLINSMPGSECQTVAPDDMAAYHEWVKGIASQIGDAGAVVILEPGSLVKVPGTANCDPRGSAAQRYDNLRRAARTLKAKPRTAVYLDGSQDLYPGTAIMAERLIHAGIGEVDGFFLNTAGFQDTDRSVAYGKSLSACVSVQLTSGTKGCPTDVPADPSKMPHFVVDTSRNGRGSWRPTKHYADPQVWCNPPGRGPGARPTTATGEELVDAYLWIARAGSSNGRCRRGTSGEKDPERGVVAPEAGEWWPEMALERAKLANPPLR
jgi:hypothetical protein